MTDKASIYTIAIIGGTGKEGKGLAYRWARAGHHVIIGSRSFEKAQAAVRFLDEMLVEPFDLRGMSNADAVKACDIAVVTVPYSAHRQTLEALKPYLLDKIDLKK